MRRDSTVHSRVCGGDSRVWSSAFPVRGAEPGGAELHRDAPIAPESHRLHRAPQRAGPRAGLPWGSDRLPDLTVYGFDLAGCTFDLAVSKPDSTVCAAVRSPGATRPPVPTGGRHLHPARQRWPVAVRSGRAVANGGGIAVVRKGGPSPFDLRPITAAGCARTDRIADGGVEGGVAGRALGVGLCIRNTEGGVQEIARDDDGAPIGVAFQFPKVRRGTQLGASLGTKSGLSRDQV